MKLFKIRGQKQKVLFREKVKMSRKVSGMILGIVLGLFTVSQNANALPKWAIWCCGKDLICCKRAHFKEITDFTPFPNDPELSKERMMWQAVQKANDDAVKSLASAEAKLKAADAAARSANQNLDNAKKAVEAARAKVDATQLPSQ
jgi:hypothetical protein